MESIHRAQRRGHPKKDFIRERYVHCGHQAPTRYKTVIKLLFEKGILKSETDLSAEMKKEQEKDNDYYATKTIKCIFYANNNRAFKRKAQKKIEASNNF